MARKNKIKRMILSHKKIQIKKKTIFKNNNMNTNDIFVIKEDLFDNYF